MIVRGAKHILRGILFETEMTQLAPTISHFLNCFLGSLAKKSLKKKKKKKPTSTKSKTTTLTPESLWAIIRKEVSERFQYEIQEEEDKMNLLVIPTLRNFCQKLGIKIAAKNYDFVSETPFQVEDILDLYPVVKHPSPKTQDGHDLLEAGVSLLAQGRLDVAFELLSEALVIFSQVYGPMHQATAICFRYVLCSSERCSFAL